MRTLLHEIFIYVVAFYLKSKNSDAVSYILSKTYFVGRYGYNEDQSFNVFYDNNENFDRAVSQKTVKNIILEQRAIGLITLMQKYATKMNLFLLISFVIMHLYLLKITQMSGFGFR